MSDLAAARSTAWQLVERGGRRVDKATTAGTGAPTLGGLASYRLRRTRDHPPLPNCAGHASDDAGNTTPAPATIAAADT